jgi:hypothetical protein
MGEKGSKILQMGEGFKEAISLGVEGQAKLRPTAQESTCAEQRQMLWAELTCAKSPRQERSILLGTFGLTGHCWQGDIFG